NPVELNEGIDSAKIGYEVTGVRETRTDDANWSLYPNPANNNIIVKGTENIEGIVIYNVLGEKVYEANKINRESETVSIIDLANGVYIAKIQTAKGSSSKRFVVAR